MVETVASTEKPLLANKVVAVPASCESTPDAFSPKPVMLPRLLNRAGKGTVSPFGEKMASCTAPATVIETLCSVPSDVSKPGVSTVKPWPW